MIKINRFQPTAPNLEPVGKKHLRIFQHTSGTYRNIPPRPNSSCFGIPGKKRGFSLGNAMPGGIIWRYHRGPTPPKRTPEGVEPTSWRVGTLVGPETWSFFFSKMRLQDGGVK